MSEELPESPFPEFKKSGPAPLEEIQELAGRLPNDSERLDEMLEQFDYLIDVGPWEEMDCEFIYICATLALAAPKFSPKQKATVLASLKHGMGELDGCGDLSEDALRSTMASFRESGYEESRSVQQWVEHYNTEFELWAKSMEEGLEAFGQADDVGFFGEDGEEDEEDAEGGEDEEDGGDK